MQNILRCAVTLCSAAAVMVAHADLPPTPGTPVAPIKESFEKRVVAKGLGNPHNMVFGPDGYLWATEQVARRVIRVDPESGQGANQMDYLCVPNQAQTLPTADEVKAADWRHYVGKILRLNLDGTIPAENGKTAPLGVPVQREAEWSDPDFVEPIKTLFTVDNNYSYTDPVCAGQGLYFICWPTIAPPSVTYYKGGKAGTPGWEHSLLITSLKRGVVYRVKLDDTDSLPLGDAQPMFRAVDRYQEVVVSPDGGTLYVATDMGHLGTLDAGSAALKLENPGAILAFKHLTSK